MPAPRRLVALALAATPPFACAAAPAAAAAAPAGTTPVLATGAGISAAQACGLRSVARAAGMRRFAERGHWASAQVTPADQARLFLRIDRLVPARHRGYARTLLASIVRGQRWGIARVAARQHISAFFKGGWRRGIVHQVALLERDGRRIALAVLTGGQPSQAYGRATLEGIAARVLR